MLLLQNVIQSFPFAEKTPGSMVWSDLGYKPVRGVWDQKSLLPAPSAPCWDKGSL